MAEMLCYCFEFTREQMAREVAATGDSTIPDLVIDRCRRGLQSCEVKNPSGRCCLPEVRRALAAMKATHDEPGAPGCCSGSVCDAGPGEEASDDQT